MPAANAATLNVVAAIIHNHKQQVLLTYRHAKQHQGERWEFPGGKVEAKESLSEALTRELNEELGITPTHFTPFLTLTYAYPERVVRLHFYDVWQFAGEPQAREGQPMKWWPLTALPRLPFPDANVPVVRALQLPEQWFVLTAPASEAQQQLKQVLSDKKVGGVYLRGDYSETLLEGLLLLCEHANCLSLLPVRNAARLELALSRAARLGASGVHLPERIANQLTTLPTSPLLYSMACHTDKSLQQAERLGVDMAFLSPVKRTSSHIEVEPLGWPRFAQWAQQVAIPVYALGGLNPLDLATARANGARGIAGISGYLR